MKTKITTILMGLAMVSTITVTAQPHYDGEVASESDTTTVTTTDTSTATTGDTANVVEYSTAIAQDTMDRAPLAVKPTAQSILTQSTTTETATISNDSLKIQKVAPITKVEKVTTVSKGTSVSEDSAKGYKSMAEKATEANKYLAQVQNLKAADSKREAGMLRQGDLNEIKTKNMFMKMTNCAGSGRAQGPGTEVTLNDLRTVGKKVCVTTNANLRVKCEVGKRADLDKLLDTGERLEGGNSIAMRDAYPGDNFAILNCGNITGKQGGLGNEYFADPDKAAAARAVGTYEPQVFNNWVLHVPPQDNTQIGGAYSAKMGIKEANIIGGGGGAGGAGNGVLGQDAAPK